jgi:hypothetical protein
VYEVSAAFAQGEGGPADSNRCTVKDDSGEDGGVGGCGMASAGRLPGHRIA